MIIIFVIRHLRSCTRSCFIRGKELEMCQFQMIISSIMILIFYLLIWIFNYHLRRSRSISVSRPEILGKKCPSNIFLFGDSTTQENMFSTLTQVELVLATSVKEFIRRLIQKNLIDLSDLPVRGVGGNVNVVHFHIYISLLLFYHHTARHHVGDRL